MYLCYDIRGIQSFIFRIPKLKYIIGGSAVIDRFDRETSKNLMLPQGCERLFTGGGKGTFSCSTKEAAEELRSVILGEATKIGVDIRFGIDEDYDKASKHATDLYPYIPANLSGEYPCNISGLYPVDFPKAEHPIVKSRLFNREAPRDSEEYNKVMEVSNWIESNISNKIFFKQLFDYSDEVLDMEIRKHKLVHGVDYIFYDTLKPYGQEDWGMFKQTTTKLSTLAIEIDVFIYTSIQMTDDTVFTDVFSLSSNNVASAKSIKHVLDMMLLSVHLKKEEYHKYKIITLDGKWGKSSTIDLNVDKRYVASVVEKNRLGRKDVVPVYEVNLDLNTWIEVGELIKAK